MAKSRNPWLWVPSLYLAEGLPYVLVMTVSVIMYKRLEVSNTEIALYTSWLYLPWVIKPLWSPVVDLLRTKRAWIVATQLVVGAGLAGVALTLPGEGFFRYSLAFLWLVAFSSATHDIAADGFYMLGLSQHQQAWFVGVRSTFYRVATIAGQGGLVILAGQLEVVSGAIRRSWSIAFLVVAVLFGGFFLYHALVLPRPAADAPRAQATPARLLGEFFTTFARFFAKPRIALVLAFLLLYRLGEAQLVKLATPFLLDQPSAGGLGLSTSQVGFAYGTVGVAALTIGGLVGGFLVARHGLRRWIWWMLVAINVPDLVYVFLAYTQLNDFVLVNACIAVEQFGYGLGFTAFLLYLIYVAEGELKTSHYAIGTGFMALGMMLPGMVSGWIQEQLGYQHFFVWVCLSTVPAFVVTRFIPLSADFGKKTTTEGGEG